MKNKILLFASLLLIFASCSKKDEPIVVLSTTTPPTSTVGDDIVTTYVSLVAPHSWNYSTETIVSPNTVGSNGTADLTVGSNFVDSGFTYNTMTTPNSTASGFYCNQLKDNHLRVDGSSVKMTGRFKFKIGTNTIYFPVTDLVIFKENAMSGAFISITEPNSTSFLVSTFNVRVNYTVQVQAGDYYTNKTVNNIVYPDVKKMKLIITMDANTVLPSPLNLTELLEPRSQNVIISEQYYAKNVGVIEAFTKVRFNLNPVISTVAPTVPASGLQTITDKLVTKNF